MNKSSFLFFFLILFVIGCSNTITDPTYIAPTIKDISISNVNNGIALSWNIELLEGFEKTVYIYRSVSTSSIIRVGETNQDNFVDQYIDLGKSYYYVIQIIEERQSTNAEYASYSTSSALLASPVSIAGKGEIDTVSNIVLKSGGGKIDLSWDVIPNDIDENYTKTYQIYRRKYVAGQNGSGRLFTTMNTSYSDNDFTYGDIVEDTYYYTILPIIIATESNIKYYGLESDPVSGIPSISTQ